MFRSYPEETLQSRVFLGLAMASGWVTAAIVVLCCWYVLGLKFRTFAFHARSAFLFITALWVLKLSLTTPRLWFLDREERRLYGVSYRSFRFGVVCGIAFVVYGCYYAWGAFRSPEDGESIALAISAVLSLAAGFGILRRYIYGLLFASLQFVMAIGMTYHSPGSLIFGAILILGCVLSILYFWKRAREFHGGLLDRAIIGAGVLAVAKIKELMRKE